MTEFTKQMDKGSNGDSYQEDSGFQPMETDDAEDFETISSVRWDKAFSYNCPIQLMGSHR